MSENHLPEGYSPVTPVLVVNDIVKVIDFVTTGLGGRELFRMPGPDGKIMHAEVTLEGARIMLGPACDDFPAVRTTLYCYVPNCDVAFETAVAAGGKEISPPADQFWGDRTAQVADPEGNIWWLAQMKERLTADQVMERVSSVA